MKPAWMMAGIGMVGTIVLGGCDRRAAGSDLEARLDSTQAALVQLWEATAKMNRQLREQVYVDSAAIGRIKIDTVPPPRCPPRCLDTIPQVAEGLRR